MRLPFFKSKITTMPDPNILNVVDKITGPQLKNIETQYLALKELLNKEEIISLWEIYLNEYTKSIPRLEARTAMQKLWGDLEIKIKDYCAMVVSYEIENSPAWVKLRRELKKEEPKRRDHEDHQKIEQEILNKNPDWLFLKPNDKRDKIREEKLKLEEKEKAMEINLTVLKENYQTLKTHLGNLTVHKQKAVYKECLDHRQGTTIEVVERKRCIVM